MTKKPAVILLSGGLDSATCLAIAKAEGFAPYCLSFDYGQKHNAELKAAARVAEALGAVEHRILKIDLAGFGGSALTDATIDVPTDGGKPGEIPVTYVPARNTVLLSYALAWSEVLKADDIFIGVNAVDYSGYPDCRPEYIASFQAMARLATKVGVEGSNLTIHTPLLKLTKAEIAQKGTELGVDYALTVTCYKADEDGQACGECEACRLRSAGFAQAGLADPTRYQGE
ncbi:7-cyano-7-deazaguanine synthase QueC [Iodobacter fluviatilis]|uniref:7-cyano-7-deazaguanine synthase n=1 Tax=Iodobacter fluviatilis TaxID=537 RepID=A0A377SUQ2_9NEIS|nr:7-cyano-7-deazaguanine synthase QueC [Iodobacter fluviatilis]TCU86312.1 preQ(0) biosynthesis protein QueC [Iodobacter fluviatilis]STR44723.1 7-cyano-7-deazaguanine synthase [Iodobacter fluviatilis]